MKAAESEANEREGWSKAILWLLVLADHEDGVGSRQRRTTLRSAGWLRAKPRTLPPSCMAVNGRATQQCMQHILNNHPNSKGPWSRSYAVLLLRVTARDS
jgi:hypothetical protein